MNKEQREIVSVTGRLLWLAAHHRGVTWGQHDTHEHTMLAAHTLLMDMLHEEFLTISGSPRKMKGSSQGRRQTRGASPESVTHRVTSQTASRRQGMRRDAPETAGSCDAALSSDSSSCDTRQEVTHARGTPAGPLDPALDAADQGRPRRLRHGKGSQPLGGQ